jgi:RNA polymerase sigma factor (TIGR02999 family)
MSSPEADGDITSLLLQWGEGDRLALERMLPLVYDELRRLAGSYLNRERPGHTLQTTALVHEAYMRLVNQRQVKANSRAHFFGICAALMRRILVDHARRRGAAKRGSAPPKVSVDDALAVALERDDQLVALDEALSALAAVDERQARVVELRFFGGLSVEDAAETLGLSPATIKREWALARAWLHKEIGA